MLFKAEDVKHELNKLTSNELHNDEINMHIVMVSQKDFPEWQFSSYWGGMFQVNFMSQNQISLL